MQVNTMHQTNLTPLAKKKNKFRDLVCVRTQREAQGGGVALLQ